LEEQSLCSGKITASVHGRVEALLRGEHSLYSGKSSGKYASAAMING
jgi:hypothetical protein